MTDPREIAEKLIELAERVEAATGSEQAQLLRDAFCAINGSFQRALLLPEVEQTALFSRCIGAEAYLDAAMTLVPEGWGYTIWPRFAEVRHPRLREKDCPAPAATPALALTAACLRAHASILMGKKG